MVWIKVGERKIKTQIFCQPYLLPEGEQVKPNHLMASLSLPLSWAMGRELLSLFYVRNFTATHIHNFQEINLFLLFCTIIELEKRGYNSILKI